MAVVAGYLAHNVMPAKGTALSSVRELPAILRHRGARESMPYGDHLGEALLGTVMTAARMWAAFADTRARFSVPNARHAAVSSESVGSVPGTT